MRAKQGVADRQGIRSRPDQLCGIIAIDATYCDNGNTELKISLLQQVNGGNHGIRLCEGSKKSPEINAVGSIALGFHGRLECVVAGNPNDFFMTQFKPRLRDGSVVPS